MVWEIILLRERCILKMTLPEVSVKQTEHRNTYGGTGYEEEIYQSF